nr:PREDICTED: uncharacterized protein LOC106704297 [Latimeria chalumnae]|eukprot:XP_014346487.1 PREDICTED: uncharacterized protein LOC106704297 [Latimeria chalumnae]
MGNVCGCVRGQKEECSIDPAKAPLSHEKHSRGRKYFQRKKRKKSTTSADAALMKQSWDETPKGTLLPKANEGTDRNRASLGSPGSQSMPAADKEEGTNILADTTSNPSCHFAEVKIPSPPTCHSPRGSFKGSKGLSGAATENDSSIPLVKDKKWLTQFQARDMLCRGKRGVQFKRASSLSALENVLRDWHIENGMVGKKFRSLTDIFDHCTLLMREGTDIFFQGISQSHPEQFVLDEANVQGKTVLAYCGLPFPVSQEEIFGNSFSTDNKVITEYSDYLLSSLHRLSCILS